MMISGGKCNFCQNISSLHPRIHLPVWVDSSGSTRFDVPIELQELREGEKLMIQKLSVYVPLHHLKAGQVGIKGHVCAIPNQLKDVCCHLPCLPHEVSFVKVTKRFKMDKTSIGSVSFMIRKKKVLEALRWLKQNNVLCNDISICKENLEWMGDAEEAELPNADSYESSIDEDMEPEEIDLGPSVDQINIENNISTVGLIDEVFTPQPQEKDAKIMREITKSLDVGKEKSKIAKYDLPYCVESAVNEFHYENIFAQAFPWLFPGGRGDKRDYSLDGNDLELWMQRLLHFQDARFSSDNVWCFYALNFLNQRKNQLSRNFYVDTFFKDGPKDLGQLKTQLEKGNTEWIDQLSYWSHRV